MIDVLDRTIQSTLHDRGPEGLDVVATYTLTTEGDVVIQTVTPLGMPQIVLEIDAEEREHLEFEAQAHWIDN